MSNERFELRNCVPLSLNEVVDNLWHCGALNMGVDERRGDVRVEGDDELAVDIHVSDPSDPRIDGHLDRTEVFTLADIRRHFKAADYYTWAKDEDGDDVLLCFGC